MKKVGKIIIKKDSEFWKSMQEVANQDAEKAAAQAAERAKKEVLERAERRAAEKKAYEDSLRDYDSYPFENKTLITKLNNCYARISKLNAQLSKEYGEVEKLRKELQNKCSHKEVIERGTKWTDEYDQWHDGHYERKCVECHLVEKSDYPVSDKKYGYFSEESKYHKLEKSQVVLLHKTVGDKEFELEFDDLTWTD